MNLTLGRRVLRLTGLRKLVWPELGLSRRDLLQYYSDVAAALFPHLCDRPMTIKRYPRGAAGPAVVMNRAPASRPEWVDTCAIEHPAAGLVDLPMIQDLASLLWLVNLGCIDLHPWQATCDDVHRPDHMRFGLGPTPGAGFRQVREAALLLRDALTELEIPSFAKTSGSRGIHVYVPIMRGPEQRSVWQFAKTLARGLEQHHPKLITAESSPARRPRSRVWIDYNQNGWGHAVASVYSARPTPEAAVSAPVSWAELTRGVEPADFRVDNMPGRIRAIGDLWKPMLVQQGRFRLENLFG